MEKIAHIVAIIGLIITILGMQFKDKKNILIAISIVNLLFVIHYFLLGALVGAVMNIISTVRTITFYCTEKNEKKPSNLSLTIFVLLTLIMGYITFDNIYSLIPIISTISVTYGAWQKNVKVLRLMILMANSIIMIYDIHYNAYVALITDILVLTSVIISIFRYDRLRKNDI